MRYKLPIKQPENVIVKLQLDLWIVKVIFNALC
jgi:hypothetical protein